MGRAFSALLLATLLAGCKDDDPSYDGRLSDLASELVVSVEVIGTPNPATPRRILVTLDPGPSATRDQDNLCAVVEAQASVNGLALEQTQKGDYFYTGGGILSGYSGCYPITFERALPEELPPELLEELTRVQVRDESGVVLVEARGLFQSVRATFVEPADGVMTPGDLVSLAVEPSPEMLPWRLSGYYRADVPGDSFGLGEIEINETGIQFHVFERAVASSGAIKFSSDSGGPFRGIVDTCQGAARCSAARTSGVTYSDGFDSLVLPASVAAEN
ncbi:MAG TPA: hypothetical protein VER96_26885 [Polyangiaceae bacterium]|nr:hypothetical protein [Polyangiaceae bacterium]